MSQTAAPPPPVDTAPPAGTALSPAPDLAAPLSAPLSAPVYAPVYAPGELAALAARHGLTVSGARPTLGAYIRQLWGRRHFITAFATAKLTAQYSQAKLGQVWQIMTPLLNATVYYFVFGVLMNTRHGVADFVPFLVTGVFIWTFTSSSLTAGTRAISGNIGLVRALHFPRASLPVALALQQLQQLLFSLGALFLILLAFGQYPRPSWLLAVPALALQTLFNTGASMAVARLTAKTPDIAQLMPFVLRTWMYASGVMWSMDQMLTSDRVPHPVAVALEYNPAALFMNLIRYALIDSYSWDHLPPLAWAAAAGWALVCGVAGFVYFWKAEETYGRG